HLIHYCMTIGNHDMIDAMMVEEAKEYFSRNPIKEDIQYDSCYTIAMLDEKNNVKTLEDIEHEAIMIALRHHEHNVMRTSKALGIAKSTLYKKIHEKNITIEGHH
ncbi:MAG: helix-turn-helix domain-containing protein, partial [Rickettsiales bacterium]|nr:helix-turn-helix domain-containing protein [Rickettsiales bacterium]